MTDAVVRKSNVDVVEDNTKGRGRPKLTWEAVIRKDPSFLNIMEHNALNKKMERNRFIWPQLIGT